MSPGRGYTLLEMLVVVGILALATAMVAPAGYRMARSWQQADQVKAVQRDLERLPLVARQQGRKLVIDKGRYQGQLVELPLPAGWSLELSTPLTVRVNGACDAANGILDTSAQRRAFRVETPYCRLVWTDQAP